MERGRLQVESSFFADYFTPELERHEYSADGVSVLDEAEASVFWDARFGLGTTCYFDIPDGSWLDTRPWTCVASWREFAGSAHDTSSVASVLRAAMAWPPDEPLLFCARRSVLLSVTWRLFLGLWDCFLTLEDDCPILVPEKDGVCGAVLFTALGEMRVYSE